MPARGQLRGRAGGCYRGETHRGEYKVGKDEVEEAAGSVERADQPEQVQEAEEGPRKGAKGRGQGAGGVGAGLRSRICAHRLLAGAPSPPPEPPPSVVREAHLVHARRVAPRRDACVAAHRQPPARASPSSPAGSPHPRSGANDGRAVLRCSAVRRPSAHAAGYPPGCSSFIHRLPPRPDDQDRYDTQVELL